MQKLILLILLVSVSACSHYNPVYDPKSSKDGGKNYYSDMSECEHIINRNFGFWDSEHKPKLLDQCLKQRDYSVLSIN
jgi:hypothetical protein